MLLYYYTQSLYIDPRPLNIKIYNQPINHSDFLFTIWDQCCRSIEITYPIEFILELRESLGDWSKEHLVVAELRFHLLIDGFNIHVEREFRGEQMLKRFEEEIRRVVHWAHEFLIDRFHVFFVVERLLSNLHREARVRDHCGESFDDRVTFR